MEGLYSSARYRAAFIVVGILAFAQSAQPQGKTPVSCGVTIGASATQGMPPAGTTGGTFHVAGAGKLTNKLDLTSDLLIVADGDLDIDAAISQKNAYPALGTPAISVSLVSINGTVTVNAIVRLGGSAAGKDVAETGSFAAIAFGERGTDAGFIRISGVNVNITESVHGGEGGWGGNTTAKAIYLGLIEVGATAYGGSGASGGDVLICGEDSIHVGAKSGTIRLEGGWGGWGGDGWAKGAAGGPGVAYGGVGGDGSDVIFRDRAQTGVVQAFIDQSVIVEAGDGGPGGNGHAYGGDAFGFFLPLQIKTRDRIEACEM